MMQKVRGLVSAFYGFTGLFHISFSVPSRYFCLLLPWVPFLSPILRGKNGLVRLNYVYFGLDDVFLL